MRNIVIAAHDPGGANQIAPVIEVLAKESNFSLTVLLLGPARAKINTRSENITYIKLNYTSSAENIKEEKVSQNELRDYFESNNVDLVFTATSYNCNLEKLLIKLSKGKGIPSLSIIDSWSNYGPRFTLDGETTYTDYIFTLDEKMKLDVSALSPDSEIIVCGNPHLQKIQQNYFRKRELKDIKTSGTIRFFSDNYFYCHPDNSTNEFTVVENICNCLVDNKIDAKVLLRPHPLEDITVWKNFIDEKGLNEYLSLDNSGFEEYITGDFIAIGLCTAAMLETSLAGVPTFSYQIGFENKEYFYIPFENYGVKKIIDESELLDVLSYNFTMPIQKENIFSTSEVIVATIENIFKKANESI